MGGVISERVKLNDNLAEGYDLPLFIIFRYQLDFVQSLVNGFLEATRIGFLA